MITKADWNDALDAWSVEERERLGDPPTPEEVVAYLSGELPPVAAARVRALLIYYPELTPLLMERIEKPQQLRKQMRKPIALRLYAVAATLALVVACADAIHERRQSIIPVALSSHHEFTAEYTRGPEPSYALPGGQQRYLITAVPSATPAEPEYELEIARDARVLWTASNVRPIDNAFVIDIPGAFLTPGTYTLSIRANERLVDRIRFRVTE